MTRANLQTCATSRIIIPFRRSCHMPFYKLIPLFSHFWYQIFVFQFPNDVIPVYYFFIILLLFAGYILNLSLIQLSSAFVSWMKDVIYSPSLEIYWLKMPLLFIVVLQVQCWRDDRRSRDQRPQVSEKFSTKREVIYHNERRFVYNRTIFFLSFFGI